MKKIAILLTLILTIIASTSLFACKNDELELQPVNGEITQVVNGNKVYDVLTERINPKLSYTEDVKYKKWKEEIKDKFIDLFGLDEIEKNACPLDVVIESNEEIAANDYMPAHTRIKFVFNSEYGSTVPCYLLIPKTGKASYPLAITLQGHADEGYANSVGIALSAETVEYANGRGAFAIQAVEQGYIALAIEQRGMGCRRPSGPNQQGGDDCGYTAHKSLLLGRTINGERIWDVSKAIDALSDSAISSIVPNIDLNDITITGNSGGGTTSFYAACYDERIKVCAPSCSFCSWEYSIMFSRHCSCNFVPGAYQWFDMQDLACLIAPRKLAVIAGTKDNIFPVSGVEFAFETVKKIYAHLDAPNNCTIQTTSEGHFWCEDIVWNAINTARAQ